MYRLLHSLIIVLVWSVAFCIAQEPVDLRSEAELQKPLTIQAKFLPLREFVRFVAEQTGVRLGVDTRYEQEKITLFVKARPAWEVMEQVAEVVDLEWHSAKTGGYFLARGAVRIDQEQKIQKARADRFQHLEKTLFRDYQRFAQLDYPELIRRAESLSAELERIKHLQPPDWQELFSQLQQELSLLEPVLFIPTYLAGRITAPWRREQWLQIWQGRPYIARFPSNDFLPELPPQVLEWIMLSTSYRPKQIHPDLSHPDLLQEPEPQNEPLPPPSQQVRSVLFFIKYFSDQERLVYGIHAEGGVTLVTSHTTDPLEATEFIESSMPTTQLDESLKAISLTARQEKPKGDYYAEGYTLAEELEWLAEQCEIPVVAQAFRIMRHDAKDLSVFPKSLYEWAQRITEREPYAVEFRNGYLRVRYTIAPLLRLREIPESHLQLLEKRASEKRSLTIDDYAELVSLLLPEQERFFSNPYVGRYYLKPAVRFDFTPLASALPALRFWASLTTNQRQQAIEAVPLFYNQLTLTQQRLFVEALESNENYISTGIVLELAPYLYDPSLSTNLAFFLDRWTDEEWTVSYDNMQITFESEAEARAYIQEHLTGQTYTLRDRTGKQWRFHFGVSISQSVVYQITQSEATK